jgi:hypothetical protein
VSGTTTEVEPRRGQRSRAMQEHLQDASGCLRVEPVFQSKPRTQRTLSYSVSSVSSVAM